MRVVIMVHHFHPHVGGVEMTAEVLGRGLAGRYGDEVLIVTHTEWEGDDGAFPFRVLRAPSPRELWRAVSGADVVLHNNPCLQFWWPQLFTTTPIAMAIRTHVTLAGQALSPIDRVKYHAKYALIEGADELTATSQHMATHLPCRMTVIPNSYRNDIFMITRPPAERDPASLIYFGRLTGDKGADIFIDAAAELIRQGLPASFTVLGDGPEASELKEQAERLGIGDRTKFLGEADGPRAARELNDHAIAVIPSRVPEAFGTVALEAAASGCVVVGSDYGGLPEAIGPSGPTFPVADVDALVEVLTGLIREPASADPYREAAQQHVQAHHEHVMVDRFREVLRRVADGHGRNRDARSLRGRLRRWRDPWPPDRSTRGDGGFRYRRVASPWSARPETTDQESA